jgi:photosystem II stability/assembly factor-like uncharacterized protein
MPGTLSTTFRSRSVARVRFFICSRALLLLVLLPVCCGSAYAQWVQTSGPNGGYVRALAFSGPNIFAGLYREGGIYRSTDYGVNWSRTITGLTNLDVFSLAIVGSNCFAGTRYGVFRSTDNGSTWSEANTGFPTTAVYALAVKGSTLFAGTSSRAVYASTDDGASWSPANGGSNYQVNALAILGSYLFAATEGGVLFSTDSGTSWAWTSLSGTITSLVVSGTDLIAGTKGKGVFISRNNGSTWSEANGGIGSLYVTSLAAFGANLFAGTWNGFYISNNSGGLWRSANNGIVGQVNVLTFSGSGLWGGTEGGGVFVTTDGGAQWNSAGNGMPGSIVACFATSGTNLFAGTYYSGVSLTTDNGTNWGAKNSGLTTANISALLVSGTTLFASGYYGGVFYSENNGMNWSAGTGLPDYGTYALASMGENLFVGLPYYGLYRSTDKGRSWTAVNTSLANKSILSFAVSGTDLFAGTLYGVIRSTDGGTSWSDPTGPAEPRSLTVVESNLFAGARFEVYRSSDKGTSWTKIISGLKTYNSVNALAGSGWYVFAGTDDGVFMMTDTDSLWKSASDSLTSRRVNALSVVGTNLYAGTNYGVWRCSIPYLTAVSPSTDELPADFELAQNYPNPFNPTTRIRYVVASRQPPVVSAVRLVVYDLLGREVVVLVNEKKEAGTYTVEFNAGNLSSGVYLYRLQADGAVRTRKMLVLR